MPIGDRKPWEEQLREGAARAEEELHRVVAYLNDEVVPDIRKNGSKALRVAAEELHKLAQRMDDHSAAGPGRPHADEDKTPL